MNKSMNQNIKLPTPDYLTPYFGANGELGTVGSLAIKESLSRGSLHAVKELLDSMSAQDMANILRETGFMVSLGAIEKGRDAVLAEVNDDLAEAAELRVDGFGLDDARYSLDFDAPAIAHETNAFAAKVQNEVVDLDFTSLDFTGDRGALKEIQGVLNSNHVQVEVFGEAAPQDRGALLFVAGQALEKRVQGFGFDGIEGKYEVPFSMTELTELHRGAARSVAEESARMALGVWANGGKVNELSDWVPDSLQRILRSSLSVESTEAIVNAIEGGAIAQHAGDIGEHEFGRILAEQGLDVKAPTIAQQAEDLGLTLITPDENRGQYVGPIVGLDHRAGLIKFAREKAVELPFSALGSEHTPKMGDVVRMRFNEGQLAVSTAARMGRESVGR